MTGQNIEALPLEVTRQGFLETTFTDHSKQSCLLRECSPNSFDPPSVWLGVELDSSGNYVRLGMHLTQAQVAQLLPHLIEFAETGKLGE